MEAAYRNKKLVSGKYWCESDSTGCLVGQIAHEDDMPHKKFSDDMQMPLWFPHLLDSVFEGLPDGTRQKFAVDVIRAIPVGFSNWQSFYHRISIFNIEKICKNADHPIVRQAIADIVVLHKNEEKDDRKWSAARLAAWSARSAAESAWSARSARSAAESAWSARSAAESAWSARSAAESAAWSAESATWSAAESAESAELARLAAYQKIAEKIISLFKEEYSI